MKSRLIYLVFFLFSLNGLAINSAVAKDFYYGLNMGSAKQDGKFKITDNTVNPTVNINDPKDYQAPDEIALSYSLFAAYRVSADTFLEFGFGKNSQIDDERRILDSGEAGQESLETDYMYVAFVGVWPVSNNYALNSKLGFSVWNVDFTQVVTDPLVANPGPADIIRTESPSDSTSGLMLGLGLSYGYSENIELRLSVDHHFVDFAFTNVDLEYDATVLTISSAYYF